MSKTRIPAKHFNPPPNHAGGTQTQPFHTQISFYISTNRPVCKRRRPIRSIDTQTQAPSPSTKIYHRPPRTKLISLPCLATYTHTHTAPSLSSARPFTKAWREAEAPMAYPPLRILLHHHHHHKRTWAWKWRSQGRFTTTPTPSPPPSPPPLQAPRPEGGCLTQACRAPSIL